MKVVLTVLKGILILLCLVMTACSTNEELSPDPVKYSKPVPGICDADTANKYHILVPEYSDHSQKFPLIIVLDSHGDGKMAVHKFSPAVRYFPCVIAGSDLIRNNFQGFESAIGQLISDIQNKYPVNMQQIIIAGFSGGARMAYYYSLQHPVKAVLMCGAGLGQQKPSCPVYAISGMGDFNFAEQYMHPDISSFNNDQFTSDYFHGIHEWPHPQQLTDALICLLDNNEHLEKIKLDRANALIHLVDSLEENDNDLMAWKALEKATKMSVSKKEKMQSLRKGKSLLKDEDFLDDIKTLENYLNSEQRLQQEYSQRLLNEDISFWKSELTALNKKLKNDTTGIKGDHYLRIKGFLGILLYSVVNKMIYNDPDNPQLVKLLEIYALAEPKNPDPWYYKALHAYHIEDSKLCLEYLNRALKLGFNDHNKLLRDYPGSILNQLK